MEEHTPIQVDEEVGRMRDILARIYDVTLQAYTEPDQVDSGGALSEEQLKAAADALAEVAIRAGDLADSLVEQVRERSRERLVEAFTREVGDLPPLTTPEHDRLGNRERWYWCGAYNCPDCRRRGVVPADLLIRVRSHNHLYGDEAR